MLVWGFPCLGHAQWWGICRGSRGFTARVLRSTHLHVHFCLFDGAWRLYSPPFPPPFSGKYVVSIMVPLSFVSVTVPGGCRSQGCHGYPTRSAPVLEAPPSFRAPSPSSSIVDEFNLSLSQSHGCCLPNIIVMFRIFTSRLLLVIDYYRLLLIFIDR